MVVNPSSKPSKPKSASDSGKVKKTLVASSLKKTQRKPAKRSKFKDATAREELDRNTAQLLTTSSADQKHQDAFSYNTGSKADQRRTRAQVDQAALALDMLMKS